MKTKFLALAALCAVSLALMTPAHAAPVSAKNEADVAKIESYLNDITGLSATFTQVNDLGEFRRGTLELERPGKMRVTYDAPSKDFIVADGSFINVWDGEMKSQSSVPVSSSLADILLRKEIKLSGDIAVLDISIAPARIGITLASQKDPGAGRLTFVFEDKPLKLRQWHILDPQGRNTTVSLENVRENVSFREGTFHFVPPTFGKKAGSQAPN